MELDFDSCYRAMAARDARFDGRFFTGVVTTGVYCRPVCPARTPLRRNVRFHPTAASAEAAGLRPCRRCRPETAPGTPEWVGGSSVVSRALRLIDDGYLDAHGVPELAAELHVGERHLRRLFDAHLGAAPVAVAQVRRVQAARMLVDQTDLPLAEIAYGSGFGSLRRFNTAMSGAFGRPPRELRRLARLRPAAPGRLELRLTYRPPLAWEHLLGYLGGRAIPGVEAVEDGVWRRTLRDEAATVSVRHDARRAQLVLELRGVGVGALRGTVERVRRVFDLAADPIEIDAALAADPLLAPRVARRPGLRVPGAYDPFELAVRAVLGQQVSVRAATTLAGRLVRAFGEPLPEPEGTLTHRFPAPAALAGADLRPLGLTGARAEALAGMAAAFDDGRVSLSAGSDAERAQAQLVALKGIGPWTAQYVAMRALRDPDAFPASDLGVRQALAVDGAMPTAREAERRAEAWRPWRAYAAIHLWDSLADPIESTEGTP